MADRPGLPTGAERKRQSALRRGLVKIEVPAEVLRDLDNLKTAWDMPSRAATIERLLRREKRSF